jgi:hypothetical protein
MWLLPQLTRHKRTNLRWNHFEAICDVPEIIHRLQQQRHAATIGFTPAPEHERQFHWR